MELNETHIGTRLFGELNIFEALKSMKKHQKNKTRVRTTARALVQHVSRVRTPLLAQNTRDLCRHTTNKETHNHEDRKQRHRDTETQRHRNTETQRHRDRDRDREREREREQRN